MIERRMFLAGSAAAAAGLGPGGALAQPAAATSTNAGVFRHGVASGDPLPRRRAPLDPGHPHRRRARPARAPARGSPSRWQVASDRGLPPGRRARVDGRTGPERDHTVKVDATGLAPATGLLLPLHASTARPQPVGRTRTAPAPDRLARPAPLRRRLVRQLQAGWFSPTATSPPATTSTRCCTSATTSTSTAPASTATASPTTWTPPARARPRDAQPRRLPAAARAVQDRPRPAGACTRQYPWIITWDDHEVANDAWSGGAENHQPRRGRLGHARGPRPHGVRRVDAGAAGRHRGPRRRRPGSTAGCSSAGSPS